VKCYIDNFVRLRSCIRNVNTGTRVREDGARADTGGHERAALGPTQGREMAAMGLAQDHERAVMGPAQDHVTRTA
jgi:hypothetical protein